MTATGTDPGRFAEGFASWRRVLAAAKDGDRWGIFENTAQEITSYVAKGLDRTVAADELHRIAEAYSLIELRGVDAVQAVIASAFAHVEPEPETVPPIDDDGPWWEHDEQPTPKGNGKAPRSASLDEWDAGDDPGPIPPRQWLLANQFCRGFISSVVAAGGTGKTALRLVQLLSLAIGRSLCGQHVFRRCRVLLVSLEDDDHEMQRHIEAALIHYGVSRSELKGWLFCASPKLSKLAEMRNRTRTIGPLEQQIRDAIERRRPDLVSLDPFIKTHGLEENDSGDMDFVCDLLARMAVEYNIAVDSPHHVHKGQITPGDANSGRGSSGIKDAGRLVYTLTPMSDDEASTFNIPAEERPRYVRLDTAKVNIAARSAKATWFRLVGVTIGNATDEYPNGDTVQVVEPWSPPDAWANLSVQTINAILSDIERGVLDDDDRPTGQRYSNAPAANDRAVWKVVERHCPDKAEAQCRTIIHAWLDSGLLVPKEYEDPVQRKKRSGLHVDSTKRPGSTT